MANIDDLSFSELKNWQASLDKCNYNIPQTLSDNYLTEGFKVSLCVVGVNIDGYGQTQFQSIVSAKAGDILTEDGIPVFEQSTNFIKACMYFENDSVPEEVTSDTVADFSAYYNANYPVFIGTKKLKIFVETSSKRSDPFDLYVKANFSNTEASGYATEPALVFDIKGNNTIGNDSDQTIKSLSIATNIPLFENAGDAINFLATGDTSKAINGIGGAEYTTPDDKVYYYRQTLYKTTGSFKDGINMGTKNISIYVPSTSKVVGYTTNNIPNNVHFKTRGAIQKSIYYDGESTRTYDRELGINDVFTRTTANNVLSDGNFFWYSNFSTNIPFADSEKEADDYLNDEIDLDDSPYSSHKNRTGTDKENQLDDLNDSSSRNVLSAVFVGNWSRMNDIAKKLYSTDTSIIGEIKNGLELFGNNPINFIIDCYMCPIDIDDFTTSSFDSSVQLGGLSVSLDAPMKHILSNGKIKTLASVFINETYGDFRDYDISYFLYLPFAGIFPIECAQILGKLLTIKVVYDLRSHTMKYYVFADSKLVKTTECALGVQFPLTANDQVGKAQQNLSAIGNIASTSANLVGGLASGGLQMNGTPAEYKEPINFNSSSPSLISAGTPDVNARLNVPFGNIVSSANSSSNSVIDMVSRPSVSISGNSSSSTACNDVYYPYLIIDKPETIKPPKLYSSYGIPCNKVQALGTCSGFTIANNLQMDSEMTLQEQGEIFNLFSNGVIL